ncbi:cytochrome d ubiquinol oxidase subunit II [Thermostaphylospora chromogena]|uniref:Cytochrome d ubiquinol oxidase subunit II n=1 Tax=Thermostaphylospora chromogena TaxID=35622 RepID=A0A1H1D076_9ACTN|nr:cytochrome d ubiquinol oxidase subunit II [Thermostaphylospora chromogena]SDQ69863.1 cytochrome d ubiquinol oxidase subunit II [Thermostaphylospora chromogena]
MTIGWYVTLGVFLAAYMLLDGFVTGAALLHGRLGGAERGRRATITAFGPFFMAGEVWLVVTVAALAAVFPPLESAIFKSRFPFLVLLIVAWLVRDGAIWLRSGLDGARWRAWWDRTLNAAGFGLAAAVGLLLGDLLAGRVTSGTGVTWYGLASAVVVVSLFALHGAAFLAARLPVDLAAGPAGLVRRRAPVAAGGYAALLALGVVTQHAEGTVTWSVAVLAAGAAALVGAGRLVTTRPRTSLALTGTPLAGLVLLVGVRLWPMAEASLAGAGSLAFLHGLLVFVLPVVLLAQLWLWWTFMRRIDDGSVTWF